MKAGETVKVKGKTYIAVPNLVQIMNNDSSCVGCEVSNGPKGGVCRLATEFPHCVVGLARTPTNK